MITSPVPERMRLSLAATIMLLAGLAGMVVALIVAQLTLPYAIMTPGPVTNTLGEAGDGTRLIEVTGAPSFPTDGELNFTTVRIGGGPGDGTDLFEYISARFSSEATILPVEQVFPSGATSTQIREENQAEMVGSQQEATAVALRALGYAVSETVSIAGVAESSSFVDLLDEGDVVLGVGDVRTDGADAIRAEVGKVPVGGAISLLVERDGAEVTVDGTTIGADGQPVLGIFLSREFDSEIDVTITAGDVGGPSAGMMFALGIYDVLTEGSLTNGNDISGTGTITADGEVGPIGGIIQKVIGAHDSGSTSFLAPAANCAELDGRVPDGIEVYAVDTFDTALESVRAIAEDDTAGLPRCG